VVGLVLVLVSGDTYGLVRVQPRDADVRSGPPRAHSQRIVRVPDRHPWGGKGLGATHDGTLVWLASSGNGLRRKNEGGRAGSF